MRGAAPAFALAAFALAAFAAIPARAQVAVAVTIAEEDASQRDIASKVVSVAQKKWRMLHPQLTSSQTRTCPAGNTECLRNLATRAKATHLLVVGVAPLGVRDRVVAVQLFDVTDAKPRFEESVVQSGLNEDFLDVKKLAANVVATPGPPAYVAPPPFVPVEQAPPSDIGALSVGGFILVGGGALTAGVSVLTGWALVETSPPSPQAASQVLLVGIAVGGALAGLGTMAFAVDAL